MMMLDINDAVEVAMDYMHDYCDNVYADKELIYQNMEQKVWITEFNGEPYLKQLIYMISDINPAEICSHIEGGDLKDWCEAIQVGMQMLLIKMTKGTGNNTCCDGCGFYDTYVEGKKNG